jgi:hypothetical protein
MQKLLVDTGRTISLERKYDSVGNVNSSPRNAAG